MASIPRERAKFMADRMAKASAIRGDDICSAVVECCDSETRSSTIQPSPSALVVEFQPASVKTYRDPDLLGWFLEIQRVQIIEAEKVPVESPTGGSEGSFLTTSQL
ncbi:hypothetical protein F2Q69_00056375 [Brassica cretica]|uniref:Uncharacterized protein n=1 Tax=Brassica cretica TaxID=69181 RepID=A0A8S9MPZ5_BRACR|nr:hypothetical protein F2Q69_00056375 [Brassica cretica]